MRSCLGCWGETFESGNRTLWRRRLAGLPLEREGPRVGMGGGRARRLRDIEKVDRTSEWCGHGAAMADG